MRPEIPAHLWDALEAAKKTQAIVGGLHLAGMALVAVGSLLARSPRSPVAWVPAIAFIVELGLAAMYSLAMPLHFILLGLLWGLVALTISVIVLTAARHPGAPR